MIGVYQDAFQNVSWEWDWGALDFISGIFFFLTWVSWLWLTKGLFDWLLGCWQAGLIDRLTVVSCRRFFIFDLGWKEGLGFD